MWPGKRNADHRKDRICALTGSQPFEALEPNRRCEQTIHGHLERWKADELVEDGAAEWVRTPYIDRKGRERFRAERAIRLLRKTWKGKRSTDEDGTGATKVMQLVN